MMQTFARLSLAAVLAAAAPLAANAQARKPTAPKAVVKTVPAKTTAKPAAKPAAAPAAAAPAAPSPAPAAQLAPAKAAAKANVPTTFEVGTSVVNLGVGVGNRYSYGSGLFGGSSSATPALTLSYERGVVALGPGYVGVGGIVGYQGASYDLGLGDKWRYHDIVVMARGSFHYAFVPKLDTYAGLGLGVRYLSTSYDGQTSTGTGSATDLASGLFVGGRYYFTPGIGAFAELGYDQSFLKVGLAAKF